MRKLIIGFITILWFGLAVAAAPKKVVLDVENMTCAACGLTIEKALKKVPGVTGQQIDGKAATVTVTYDRARSSVAVVARAITNAGFPAKPRASRD